MEKVQTDDGNLMLVDSQPQVDQLNTAFYNRFPFPWRPQSFDFVTDRYLQTRLLNQNLGDWKHQTVPPDPRVWVAGCGTNQAIYTGLRFPNGRVVGSDLSSKSLEICDQTARQLGLTNLELREESINGAEYTDSFDYVICTGVIHHNAEPRQALQELVRAMKPTGVLELMVYNRYHRVESTAFQKAIRLLCPRQDDNLPSDDELRLARQLIGSFPVKNRLQDMLHTMRNRPEVAVADVLIQPVEHSYTVESLVKLAAACGLEMLSPSLNEWDRASGRYLWHIDFDDPELQRMYDAMPDLRRWQFTNLMLMEKSPMLWFYFQKSSAGRSRCSQAEINEQFLDTVFERVKSTRGCFLLQSDGSYVPGQQAVPFPTAMPRPDVARIHEAVDGVQPMRQILESLQAPMTFGSLQRYRANLATSAFPFIVAR